MKYRLLVTGLLSLSLTSGFASGFKLNSVWVSAGDWISTTEEEGFSDLVEHFYSLPKIGVSASYGGLGFSLEGGMQYLRSDNGANVESKFAPGDVSFTVRRGRAFSQSLGVSVPLYQTGALLSRPFQGNGSVYVNAGLGYWTRPLADVPTFSSSTFLLGKVAVSQALANPGSFQIMAGETVEKRMSMVSVGLTLWGSYEYIDWDEGNDPSEKTANAVLAIPLKLHLSRSHSINGSGGFSLYTYREIDNGRTTYTSDVTSLYWGVQYRYAL